MFDSNSSDFKEKEIIFIDRDLSFFSYIIGYLRGFDQITLSDNANELRKLLQEAHFYSVDGVINLIKNELNKKKYDVYLTIDEFHYEDNANGKDLYGLRTDTHVSLP